MAMTVKFEKRLNPSVAMNVAVPLLSVVAAFLVGALFLTLTGRVRSKSTKLCSKERSVPDTVCRRQSSRRFP